MHDQSSINHLKALTENYLEFLSNETEGSPASGGQAVRSLLRGRSAGWVIIYYGARKMQVG